MEVDKKVAIRGKYSLSNGKKIIKYLESLGGINAENFIGNSDITSYFIDTNNLIKKCCIGDEPFGYKILKSVPKITIKKLNNYELWEY